MGTTINHPPVITIDIWYVHSSQSWVVYQSLLYPHYFHHFPHRFCHSQGFFFPCSRPPAARVAAAAPAAAAHCAPWGGCKPPPPARGGRWRRDARGPATWWAERLRSGGTFLESFFQRETTQNCTTDVLFSGFQWCSGFFFGNLFQMGKSILKNDKGNSLSLWV